MSDYQAVAHDLFTFQRYGVPSRETLLARITDPPTSHEAAAAVAPAENDMQREIRRALERWGPMNAEEIARDVQYNNPKRWLTSSIVTACNPRRSGLHVWDTEINSRGRRVQVLSLEPRP